jgi:hypothetical protein
LNIVGIATEAGNTNRYIDLWGTVEASTHGFVTTTDGQGYETMAGGRFYKAVGSGLIIRCHTGNTQPQIENNDGGGRRIILDANNGVLKAGDTMTGTLIMRANANSGALRFDMGNATNAGNIGFFTPEFTRRGYIGWSAANRNAIVAENGYFWQFQQVVFGQTPTDPAHLATKDYVDNRRGNTRVIEPNQVAITTNWITLWSGPFAIPRGGNSFVSIYIVPGLSSTAGVNSSWLFQWGVQGSVDRVRQSLHQKTTAIAQDISGGQIAFTAAVSGTNPTISIQVRSLSGPAITMLGTGGPNPDHYTQIYLSDAGPR